MPAAPSVVRLLTRQQGVLTRRQRLMMEEVFRIDIIPNFFEGAQPNLRVTFIFKEIQADEGMEESFPLELPEPIVNNVLDPGFWARRLWLALFEGNQRVMLELERLLTEDGWLGDNFRAVLRQLPDATFDPAEYFTHWNLLGLNGSFIDMSSEERDAVEMTIATIFQLYDNHSLEAVLLSTDFVGLMRFYATILPEPQSPPSEATVIVVNDD